MITEDYVSFELAKLLKEKGFDKTCRAFWKDWDNSIVLCECNRCHAFDYCFNSMLEDYNDTEETNIAAPTLQMTMKWLREVYNLYIEMKISKNTFLWGFRVSLSNGSTSYSHANVFSNYEQACEAAIKYCLENLI